MVSRLDLKTRWQKALEGIITSEDEECTSILCENDWVRILAVLNSNIHGHGRIEVEVSLPTQYDPKSRKDVRKFIQNLIKHLEYLLHLDEEGLTLGVMSRDGLWTAFLELDSMPRESLFNALVPPP